MIRTAPCSLREANAFVKAHHRHHGTARGCKFVLSVVDNSGAVRGVAIVSRPVARQMDARTVAEAVRVCTDGTKNACSMLYGACARIAEAMGYQRIITYILEDECGASLRAAGWIETARTKGESWNRKARPREDVSPTCIKIRFEKVLKGGR